MSLVGPWLSTTSTKKHKQVKYTKAQLAEFQRGWRDRNEWLKNLHLPKQSFEEYMEWIYGRGKKKKTEKKDWNKYSETVPGLYSTSSRINSKCSDDRTVNENESNMELFDKKIWVTGPCTTKQTPAYTGTKIIGISQMAKSNSVPVFSQDEIIDIARMRR